MPRADTAAKACMAGRDAMSKGDFGLALTALRSAPRADTGNPVCIHAEAVLAHRMRNFHESENLYLRVIDIAERVFGPGDPRTASIVLGLAGLYGDMGRRDKARELCRRMLDRLDRAAVAASGILSLARVTLICHWAGRLDEARRMHRQAIAYRRGVFGDGHYKLAECVIGIAELNELERAGDGVADRPTSRPTLLQPRRARLDTEVVVQ